MTTYRAIASTETDPQAPITSALMKAFQDNLLAVLERDATAPDFGASIALSAVGSVGSYALFRRTTSSDAEPGATIAGSDLRYVNAAGDAGAPNVTPSGTWRLMGNLRVGSNESLSSVFLRIS